MIALRTALVGVALAVACAALVAHLVYRLGLRRAQRAWLALAVRAVPAGGAFDPATVAGLPEPACRYLTYAIAPGTPLRTTVELEMRGQFALGDKHQHRVMPMRARQILSPPHGFVWLPRIGSGLMRILGSDGYVHGDAWTRFWLLATVPVARAAGTTDLARSAAGRAIMEAIWAPASLLPQNGAKWERVAENAARVTFDVDGEPLGMTLTLSAEGRPLTVQTVRWSDANPDKAFRWQPFGGTIAKVQRVAGYTIPTRLQAGNHYGTDDYFPFFRADIVGARYR